ncbi:MAG: CotH kinase family protein [Paludibacteraceae bacterium]|nr:CotH kinase family protein [Paludibacteraceae bacterium]
MQKKIYSALLGLLVSLTLSAADGKLTGTPIGSSPSVEYVNFTATYTENQPKDAFDGDMNTFYASYERSYTWVGLDLGSRHVITRVGWSPRNDGLGPGRMVLGVIEGANQPDFMDALPLYLIDTKGTVGQVDHADVDCSLGFRYVRYIGPNDARCNISELEFYGHKGEGDSTALYRPTNLPCVVIHTENNREPYDKVNYIESIVTIIGADGSILQDTAGLRLRGNASINFPKKPYRLKFNTKHKVLDSPAKAKNWTLINNYGDKTLMRNIVAFHVSEVCRMPYTPFCRPVDVLVNGEYKGCYQLCDKIEVKKGRVSIDEMTPTDLAGNALSGGYLWEIDGYANQEPSPYYSPHGVPVTLHSPDNDEIVPAQRSYFENYYRTMENAVYKSSANDTTWREYLDYTTFARYFLTNEVCGNPDMIWSCYMYKKRGDQKAYTGPVWDFDIAFDNDYRIYPASNHTQFIFAGASNAESFARHIVYADQRTRDEMTEYWHQARNSGIDTLSLLTFIDNTARALDASQRLNFMRWPILSQNVHMNPVALGSYAAEVDRLKNFLCMRIDWMDRKLGYTRRPFEGSTAVDNQQVNDNCRKIIRNGQLLIIRNGVEYTVTGEVRTGK